jgi:hypothetical protein
MVETAMALTAVLQTTATATGPVLRRVLRSPSRPRLICLIPLRRAPVAAPDMKSRHKSLAVVTVYFTGLVAGFLGLSCRQYAVPRSDSLAFSRGSATARWIAL